MSDSSLSSAGPTKVTLEQALRHAVQRVCRDGNLEDLTVKRIRIAAEQDLGLEDGFYKSDPKWKEESKTIIQSEVEAQSAISIGEPSASQDSSKMVPLTKDSKLHQQKVQKKGVKRSSRDKLESKKRQKRADTDNELPVDEDDEVDDTSTVVKGKKHKLQATPPSPEEHPQIESKEREESGTNPAPKDSLEEAVGSGSESEMSVLIDEEPKRKGRGRNTGSGKTSNKKSRNPKSKKETKQQADPDAEEIKRLQGWLTKCGLRTQWSKVLAPFETPKLKIQHLKKMLSEAGMTGRYSIEKAAQIREQRELKAETEDIQKGDKQWGKTGSEEDRGSKPRRRLARGLKELDFLNDGDGAETD